jgi:hypothetical protein
MMNPDSFSILGYLSVLLWLAVPLLWLLRDRIKTPGWLALAFAVLSFALATINSRSHVSRIEAEVAEASPDALMLDAAKRKAVEKARGDEVADIRFAEDGADDFIDRAGMDDADRKYLESLDESGEPAWKGRKKARGEAGQETDELDEALGGDEPAKSLSTDALPEEKETRAPILMTEPQVATARRLDGFNRGASAYAILLGLVILIADYLARANCYARAAFPLPLPAALRNAFNPLPAIVTRPADPPRTLAGELAHLARRGDVFLCFSNDTSSLPDSLPTIGKSGRPIDILRADGTRVTDAFVFESLWYGRACFTADPSRANGLLTSVIADLARRHSARARARHNVHLVWNLATPPGEEELAALEGLGPSTGFSLFIIPS